MWLKDLKKTKSEVAINTAFLLSKYEDSRDYNSRDFEILYLLEYYCDDDYDKQVIQRVMKKAPAGATIKRMKAHIINKLWLYPKSKERKQLDLELELNTRTGLRKWLLQDIFNSIKKMLWK